MSPWRCCVYPFPSLCSPFVWQHLAVFPAKEVGLTPNQCCDFQPHNGPKDQLLDSLHRQKLNLKVAMFPVLLFVIMVLNNGVFGDGSGRNVSSRPTVLNVGAIFTFDSAIGCVAKIAIDAAVADINADSSVLRGIKLNVTALDSNSDGLLGIVEREAVHTILGRLVLVVWLFVVLIVKSSYTASLTSILTVQQLSSPFTAIDSLISSGQRIGFQVGSFAETYLKELGVHKSRLVELGSPEAYAIALEKGPANGGVAAVVDERPYIDLFLSKYCKFSIRGNEFTKSGWGFAFPRDSPLTVDFSTAILSLAESGELQRIHDKWLKNEGCSSQSTDISSNELDLNCFWVLFLICAPVSALALCLHFIRISRMFIHEKHQPDDSANVRSGCIRRFISFLDKIEESKSGKKQQSEFPTAVRLVQPETLV